MIIVDFGYRSYVMANKDALALAEILEKADVYEQKWIRPEDRNEKNGAEYTHHVYANENPLVMKLVSNDLYNMSKLAGKPENK
jgi:predicted DNA-binding ArsR family transcriptional regulator